MADPNLRDFYDRCARIDRAHSRGYWFEAAGTTRSERHRRRGRIRIPVMGPVLVIVLSVVGLKAAIHHSIGPDRYAEKVAALWRGGTVDQIGALVMQPDPASLWLAERIAEFRR